MKKGSYKTIVEYAASFILLTFLHYTEYKLGVRAMALAFYFALVYNRRNVIILSPLFLAAAIIVEPTLESLIIAVVPVALVLILLFISYKARIKLRLGIMAAAVALATLPRAFLETATADGVIATVIGAVANEALFFAFVALQYLVLRKRFDFPLTGGELVSIALFGAIVGLGMGYPAVMGLRFYYIVAVYALILSASAGRSAPLFLGAALGVGVCVSGGASCAVFTAIYTVCIALAPRDYAYFGGVAGVAISALLILLGIIDDSYLSLIMPAVGVIAGVVTPQKFKEYIFRLSVTDSAYVGARTIINRNRKELSDKLSELAGSLRETSAILGDDNIAENISDCGEIAKSVSDICCKGCPNYEQCKSSLRADGTEAAIEDMVKSSLESGRASILDATPYLGARCKRLPMMINAVNDIIGGKERKTELMRGAEECRALLRNQLESLSDILTRLKEEAGEPLAYDGRVEGNIKAELNSRLIGVREVYVYGDRVGLCVRDVEGIERKAGETISKVLGRRMSLAAKEPTVNGLVGLTYIEAPVYRVAYGERVLAASDCGSGDNERVTRLTSDKVMLVLADGMGHDGPANRNSRYAVKLIESFYRAGFDHNTVLHSVGSLMSLRGREEFNAVDIAVIDTRTGNADVIKQGARESFIVRKGAVDVLECGSLPLGIVDGAEPITHTVTLTPDSFLVLVSDGVADVLGREGLIELLAGLNTLNPDDVAEAVIENFRRLSADSAERDDASVIAARIF